MKRKYEYLISYVYENPGDTKDLFGRVLLQVKRKICSRNDVIECEATIAQKGLGKNVRILSYQLI